MTFEKVLNGPAIFESTMLLTYDQQFYRTCSYSVSLWVWIWKSKRIENNEIPIFTSRPSDPIYNTYQSILPAIVFNVGNKRESFFFSALKDSNGHYVGYWSETEIKYHVWTHIALIITDSYIEGFIDGISQKKAELNMGNPESCPYFGLDLHQNYGTFINNTIFQVGGYRHGKSLVGMIQDLEIFRNTALNETDMHFIMNSHPPKTSQLFKELLNLNNIYTYDQYCPVKWQNDYFISLSLSLCPQWICGLICLEESFLLGIDMNLKYKLSSENYPKNEKYHPIEKNILNENLPNLPNNFKQNINNYDVFNETDDMYADLNDSLNDYYDDGYQQYDYDDYDESSYLEDDQSELFDFYGDDIIMMDDLYEGLTFNDIRKLVESEIGKYKKQQNNIKENKKNHQDIRNSKLKKDESVNIPNENVLDKKNTTSTPPSSQIMNVTSSNKSNYSLYKSPLPKRFFSNRIKTKSITNNSNSISLHSTVMNRLHTYFNSLYNQLDKIFSDSISIIYNQFLFVDSNSTGNPNIINATSSNIHHNNSSSSTIAGNGRINSDIHNTIYDIEYYQLSKADRVKRLYDSAMLWLSGRHEDMSIQANLSLHHWLHNATDNAFTALCFALWLADDLSVPSDKDVDWFVRYPSRLSHAIHVALGYKNMGNGRILPISVSEEERNGQISSMNISESENNSNYNKNNDKLVEKILGISLYNIFHNNISSLSNSTKLANSLSSSSLLPLKDSIDNKATQKTSTCLEIQSQNDNQTPLNLASIKNIEIIDTDKDTNTPIDEKYDTLNNKNCNDLQSESETVTVTVTESLSSSIPYLQNEKQIPSLVNNTSFESLQYNTTQPPASDIADSTSESSKTECMLAASHYFPIAQYVTSHYGIISSGVTFMENILLSDHLRDLAGHLGEGDEVNEFYEVEAEAGNVNAQLMMAKKYYWGHGGLRANVDMARRWFERAAAQNNPEGLYNMGVFHNEGIAGYTRNTTTALSYFKRSADHEHPFLLALHAMGNHYLGISDMSVRNVTLARHYFEKAAQADAPDAHYSLSTLYKDGLDVDKDIPRAVRHLAVAASLGHLRAINSLAHSLYDAESWLGAYARQQTILKNTNNTTSTNNSMPLNSSNNNNHHYHHHYNNNNKHDANGSLLSNVMPPPRASTSYQWLKDSDSKEPLVVVLPNQVVELPSPLGPSCEAALPLLKHISEHMHRTNELTRAAFNAYIRGSLWESLDLYDEAADLGVGFAQANSVFLYEKIKRSECQGTTDFVGRTLKYFIPSSDISFVESSSNYRNTSTVTYSFSDPTTNFLRMEDCSAYMDRMIIRRRLQLSQSGDLSAMTSLADELLSGSSTHLPRNAYEAVRLYSVAAERGSTQSLVSIGWIFAFGLGGFPANLTAASLLFSTAFRWETYSDIDKHEYAFSNTNTGGLAPAIGLVFVHCHWCLQKILDSMLYVLRICFGNTTITIDNILLQKIYGVDDFLLTIILCLLFLSLFIIRRRRRVGER